MTSYAHAQWEPPKPATDPEMYPDLWREASRRLTCEHALASIQYRGYGLVGEHECKCTAGCITVIPRQVIDRAVLEYHLERSDQ